MATAVLASIGDHGVLNAQLSPTLRDVWIDRDLSWLDFNERVLAEALDERTPLLERAKFLAIFTSNLDEFFMKRHAVLRLGQPMRNAPYRTRSGISFSPRFTARLNATGRQLFPAWPSTEFFSAAGTN
jgi:Polyphosphate kinase N-terminal domain